MVQKWQEANAYVERLFPLNIVGGDTYWLYVKSGRIERYSFTRQRNPTWRKLIEEAFTYCTDNSIRFDELAETGKFKHGDDGQWLQFPKLVKLYISNCILGLNKK